MLNLSKECVILDLAATTKEAVLRELAEAMRHQCPGIGIDEICRVLTEREQVGSTGVGNGVAIPHGKVEGLDRIMLCFGRSRQGIAFDVFDNQPVHLFVVILSSVGLADEYLKTLARVSRLLKQAEKRQLLRQAEDRQAIVDVFAASA